MELEGQVVKKQSDLSKPMMIKVKANAAMLYRNRQNRWRRPINQNWIKVLRKVQGKTLEVETEYLFKDQFNTKKYRIMEDMVEKIINDVREWYQRCDYCGINVRIEESVCPRCKQSVYLRSL